MGTWGTKLYEDDLALDIVKAFKELLNSGKTTEEATKILIRDYEEMIADIDDGPIFWFALADIQWNLGVLLPFVKEKAIEYIINAQDLRRWKDENSKQSVIRKKVLNELKIKLNSQMPEVKREKSQAIKKKRIKLGDIISIPLPNGKFAFARIFKESTIAVYKNIFENIKELPLTEDYVFVVGVYKDLLQDASWKVVDNRPFKNEKDAWPPRRCIKNVISGKYSIYYKGEIIPSTERECKGLEAVAVWDRNHIIDRIMGDTKWNIS